jgi:hypothetical protein
MRSNPSNRAPEPAYYTAFYRDVLRCGFVVSARSNDGIVAGLREHKITCLTCQRADQPIVFSSVSKDPEPLPYEYRQKG